MTRFNQRRWETPPQQQEAPDRLRFQPLYTPHPDEPEIEVIDLDSNRTQVKPHTWGA